jgi:hypothetical protein
MKSKKQIKEVLSMLHFMTTHSASSTLDALTAVANSPMPEGILWKMTYSDFEDNQFFLYFDAISKEAIEGFFKKNGIAYDGIHKVVTFNVVKHELE